MARLIEYYRTNIVPQLVREHGYKNTLAAPRLAKIVLNMGVGEAVADSRHIQGALADLRLIAGQQPVVTRAGKSIAGFKLRENQAIGVKVTLRSKKMYEFLDRLIHIDLPRVRDFRGISDRCFDGQGNFSFGIKEQIIFPEIGYQSVDHVRGLNVVIVTTAQTNQEAKSLLQAFNFPFAK